MSNQSYTPSQTFVVHSTNAYDKFTFDVANRPINLDHVQRLYNAIQQKNLLHLFPVVVTTTGVIRDGQHRIKAAEALNVPVYFIVSDDMDLTDVPAAAEANRGWKLMDWIHHWINVGNVEYIRLKEFQAKYPWISVPVCVSLCHYGDRAVSAQQFKTGGYKCNDLEFANEVALGVLDFAPYAPFYHHATFIYAVKMLFEHANYDHAKMMEKMGYLSRKIVKCPDTETYLEMFTDIYNHRSRSDNKIRFERLASNSVLRRADRRYRNRTRE